MKRENKTHSLTFPRPSRPCRMEAWKGNKEKEKRGRHSIGEGSREKDRSRSKKKSKTKEKVKVKAGKIFRLEERNNLRKVEEDYIH